MAKKFVYHYRHQYQIDTKPWKLLTSYWKESIADTFPWWHSNLEYFKLNANMEQLDLLISLLKEYRHYALATLQERVNWNSPTASSDSYPYPGGRLAEPMSFVNWTSQRRPQMYHTNTGTNIAPMRFALCRQGPKYFPLVEYFFSSEMKAMEDFWPDNYNKYGWSTSDAEDLHPFNMACAYGYIDMIKSMTRNAKKQQIDLDFKHTRIGTPLITACLYGQLDVVKLLLANMTEYSIDINYCHTSELYLEYDCGTCIFAACWNGHLEVVKYLVATAPQTGLDINIEHDMYGSCFNAAFWNGHVDVVEFLLENEEQIGLELDIDDVFEMPMEMDYDSDSNPDEYPDDEDEHEFVDLGEIVIS